MRENKTRRGPDVQESGIGESRPKVEFWKRKSA